MQFVVGSIWGIFKTHFPLPYLFQKDYTLSTDLGVFYIKNHSDFDYPIQPYHEDEHPKYWNLEDGEVFLDIGWHVWTYSIKLLNHNKWKKVKAYCFEPHPETYTYLLKNIELNNLHDTIYPVQKWIFSKDWHISFTKNLPKDASISKIITDATYVDDKIEIETITLDTFIQVYKLDIDSIWLIKIDVEWLEFEVFQWMELFLSQAKKVRIICEILNQWKFLEIKKFIEWKGLEIKNIDDTNFLIYSI